ncbi:MAG: Gfo/Idh/MocA family oxidoreductase [Verrucomicrobiota bacterium]|jgi:predicted dehydrogenase|nr:Gfo/Idh/MocA family oxidoreductase [Verrucomicrobiota bacterium]MDP6753652.1 Gfo/Idh/MocA family oxidoreductase [Verrucomicrobiota bacterium]
MATRVRVAVLGVGSLGRQHARIYAEMHRQGAVELVGVYDTDDALAKAIAAKHGTVALDSVEDAAGAADALSIVTPTVTHHALAKPLLEQGKHLLVEKPMTDDTDRAAELVRLAKRHDCVLQVGHIERFNPVFQYLREAAREPRFIESHRLSPFPARSMDIGVVLDLMIHDLDIVLAFVRSPVEQVDAAGVRVLSDSEDIANARLRFANGCVANLTVSRVSPESLRKIRVFSGGDAPSYVSLDYREQKGYHYRLARDDEAESSLLRKLVAGRDSAIVSQFGGRRVVREPVPIQREEPLKVELESFVRCVAEKQEPLVSGESARQAIELALEITSQIQSQND